MSDLSISCWLSVINLGRHLCLPGLSLNANVLFSGKSSVLEGLTELPFPRDSGLCTRFATQITFRRALQTKISISVIPAANVEQEYRDKLRAWKKEDLQTLNRSEFAVVLQQVSVLTAEHLCGI